MLLHLNAFLALTQSSISPNFFRGEPLTPLPMEKGHYCANVTTTTPPLRIHTPLLKKRCDNGIAVFLHATTGDLLPTLCKGSSTPFPTEKAVKSK